MCPIGGPKTVQHPARRENGPGGGGVTVSNSLRRVGSHGTRAPWLWPRDSLQNRVSTGQWLVALAMIPAVSSGASTAGGRKVISTTTSPYGLRKITGKVNQV